MGTRLQHTRNPTPEKGLTEFCTVDEGSVVHTLSPAPSPLGSYLRCEKQCGSRVFVIGWSKQYKVDSLHSVVQDGCDVSSPNGSHITVGRPQGRVSDGWSSPTSSRPKQVCETKFCIGDILDNGVPSSTLSWRTRKSIRFQWRGDPFLGTPPLPG